MEKEEKQKKPKTKLQKILDAVFTVVVVIVAIFAAFVLFITITSKRSADGAINVFGYQFRTILTGSMEKCRHDDPNEECDHVDISGCDVGHLSVGTMIFIQTVPGDEANADKWYEGIKEGDVLTFHYNGMGVVTHRVIYIEKNSTGGYVIDLMGDNRGSDGTAGVQTVITDKKDNNYIIGKVVGQNEFLGWLVTTVKSPIGAILVIFVPCLIIVIVEVVRIIMTLVASKKEKDKEKQDIAESQRNAVQSDIEELKKQIALAKQALDENSMPPSKEGEEDAPSEDNG